jgi:eukaryotic-like serine/threonine-protein kinase
MENGEAEPTRRPLRLATPFCLGDWTVTPSLNLVTRGDRCIHLRRQLMDLVVFLANRQGEVVSKEEIFQAVWPGQFVAETGLARCISQLRDVFDDDAREPKVIQTIPTRGYRLLLPVGPVDPAAQPLSSTAAAPEAIAEPAPPETGGHHGPPTPAREAAPTEAVSSRRRWRLAAASIVVIVVALAAFAQWRRNFGRPPLGEQDTVLVAFENRTGETAFDDTLQLALSIQLEQSPYLHVVSARRVSEALAYMNRPAGARVTRPLSLELCQRVGAKAVLAGSLASVGRRYVLGLEGIACESGATLARQQVEVAGKEQVLDGLGRAVSSMRERLGESVASIRRFDVPIAQASTSSFDALKALSQGDYERSRGRSEDAERWYRTAIERDPSFATAHMRLGLHLLNLSRYGEGVNAITRAYAWRERASEGERLYITAFYFNRVLRDPLRAVEPLERWGDTYPRAVVPRFTLASLYVQIGRLGLALERARGALRLEPDHTLAADVLMETLVALGRFDEAKRVGEGLVGRRRDDMVTHATMLDLACALGDAAAVRRELDWGANTPEAQAAFTDLEAAIARSGGRLGEARRLTVRRISAADKRGDALTGALSGIAEATDRALLGQTIEPRELALSAVRRARTPETLIRSALALALAGDAVNAERFLREYQGMADVDWSSDPDCRPVLLAMLALWRDEPTAAVETLAPLKPYDLGWRFGLLPSYVRGLALLRLRRPVEASAEFERVTTHPGVVATRVIHSLAWLQLARAKAAAGDSSGSRQAYDTLMRQWKDADPNVPSVLQARAEFARAR